MLASSSSSSSLVEQVVDLVVENEMLWLVQVVVARVRNKNQDDDDDEQQQQPLFRRYLSRDVTVRDLKELLLEPPFSIPLEEQRLSLHDSSKPLFFGPILDTLREEEDEEDLEDDRHQPYIPPKVITIRLDRRVLDPLETVEKSLYEITGYSSPHERDEIMWKLTHTRHPQCCRCQQGHGSLVPLFHEDVDPAASKGIIAMHDIVPLQGTADQEWKQYQCAKCNLDWGHVDDPSRIGGVVSGGTMHRLVPMVCRTCGFALCKWCYHNDEGRDYEVAVTHDDAYTELRSHALEVGWDMAETANQGGIDYFLPACLSHVVGMENYEISNQKLRQDHDEEASSGIYVDYCSTQILPSGMRLVMKLDDELRKLLCNVGFRKEVDTLEAKVNKVCEHGATHKDIAEMGRFLHESSLWPVVLEQWKNHTAANRQDPALPYVLTRTVTEYSLGQVVYEIGIASYDPRDALLGPSGDY